MKYCGLFSATRTRAIRGLHLAFLLLLISIGAAATSPAQSKNSEYTTPANAVDSEDFYRVYDYDTPAKGWFEPNFWITYVPSSRGDYGAFYKTWDREHLTAYTTELEYGVTDHFSLSAYVDFINAQGENGAAGTGLRFTQGRIEARYRFSKPKAHFFDTAAYLEYHLPAKSYADSQEMETRVILERNFKNLRLDLNPSLSFYTTGSERGNAPTANFNTGIYYERNAKVQPGAEYYAGYGELGNIPSLRYQQHLVFGTTDFNLHRGLTLQFGIGYGLTHHSDRVTVKSILSYEFNGLHRSED